MVVDVFEVLLARNAWEKRKLGETNSYFTDGNYGESYPKESELSDKENGVPFLRGSNLRNGELIEDNANYITKEKHAELTSGHLVEDDIVLAVRGSLGALGYVKDENIDWNINSQLAVIRTDKSELSGKFLVQFLLSWRGQKELLSRNTGTALKQLPIKQLKDVPVPIVNLDEQKEIGALFSSIDNLIAATQRRIDALEQAKKALLQRLFDQSWRFKGYSDPWEKRKLGELANIRRGASPRPIKSKKWFSQTSQVGWIRISDVTEQNGRIHQVEQHLSDAGQKKTLVLKSKHLLLSIAATVGKPVQNYIQVGVHDGFIVFMDPKFDLDFMFYFLEKYRPNWARFGQPGSQININSELVRDLVVSIPTVHEQDAVAQFIITLDNLIAATQSRLSSLELLKKSLLQDLFI
ncbi:restriction endonuclease subunit S [Lacticaseibacillus paracasei]|uniref:restriction endonuclease subunit S n=1 Tax=Lacticaseibacillus paracasei TaxID=1597 RepID=UPI001CDB256E|nr:restriction endonuclease subunit S [Lacticaseibacillus paracasei]WRM21463.1 restriction endonuclease subunit S [Lacticaseibacillus paracasei]